jgi:pterin-4a-carbinolamine dehydratase
LPQRRRESLARRRRADRHRNNRRLRDGRVDHAVFAEVFKKAARDAERAAHAPDVLTDDEHIRVALHLLPHCEADGFQEGDLSHRDTPARSS